MNEKTKSVLNRVLVSFLNGIIVLLPIVVTAAIVRYLVVKVNSIVLTPLLKLISMGGKEDLQHVYMAKGIIFLAVVAAVVIIGWSARIWVVRRFFSWGEKVFIKIPILGKIYNTVKQLLSAFFGKGKNIFKRVAFIEYPRKGIYSLVFVTGESKGGLVNLFGSGKKALNVFLPSTPNPATGYFMVVPEEEVIFPDMSVEEGMKLVVSGGAVGPYSAVTREEIED